MKVVVTGATGHLGGYVVSELHARGFDVVAASRSGRVPEAPFGVVREAGRVRAIELDLRADAAVSALRAELGPDVALVHLAAWHPPATAATGARERAELIETNVRGTMRALDAARRERGAGVRAVVYASTFEVYGEPGGADSIDESARTAPLTDYGATKLAGEDHLLSFAHEESARVVALRLPAIYGPGERTARALPNFLHAVARGERPIVYGDGLDLRDQIHARDAARAIGSALAGSAHGIFNVSDGERHSILELATAAITAAGSSGGPELRARVKPRRDFHMRIERARSELGFAPGVELQAGMAEQLAWIRATANGAPA